jgi:hypothetical protein
MTLNIVTSNYEVNVKGKHYTFACLSVLCDKLHFQRQGLQSSPFAQQTHSPANVQMSVSVGFWAEIFDKVLTWPSALLYKRPRVFHLESHCIRSIVPRRSLSRCRSVPDADCSSASVTTLSFIRPSSSSPTPCTAKTRFNNHRRSEYGENKFFFSFSPAHHSSSAAWPQPLNSSV